jgi:hypothetical protein
LKGPIDHDVPVLVVSRQQDKAAYAVVFGYACHSTTLSISRISGDYPGFAQEEIEARFPGCTALFCAGCGADVNPLPRRTEQLAQHYGRQLAVQVESVMLTQQLTAISGAARSQYQRVPLEFSQLPTVEQLQKQTRSANQYESMRARLLLEQIESGQPLSPTYAYPVQSWRLGDQVDWLFLGGEVVVDYSLRIKSEKPQPAGAREVVQPRATFVTAYANDVMAYIPSQRVLAEGGYEGASSMVYYGLPTIWAENVEQTIMTEIHRQLGY